jgi:HD-GYP domain-containing protein (c-di-GMP phosphodiesterase class II)
VERPPGTAQDSGVTLAELLAAFSLATDLGLGQPMEHVLRSWRLADRLAERVDLADGQRSSLYYVSVLSWVGCVADTPEVARWFGDDIGFRHASYDVDFVGMPALGMMLGRVGEGQPAWERVGRGAAIVATGGRRIQQAIAAHCLTTSRMAERLGLGPEVSEPVQQFFTRWDGRGVPGGIGGEDIVRSVRLIHLADTVEPYHHARGVEAAVEVARARRGTQFDPSLVDVFCAEAPDVLGTDADGADSYDLVAADPTLQRRLTDDELDMALEAVADFTDLRSASRAGHSRRVAELAGTAARMCGLTRADVTTVRRAGLLHDVGMHGLPATILDKPGPLTATESERMRMHVYYTDRVLARPAALARVGAVAGLVRERLDGSGYHRGLSGSAIPVPARILAAACAYAAMTEPRPYRPARTTAQATAELRAQARAGRLGTEAVDAVLAATGQRRPRRPSGPAGLTPREVEVLGLIARGATTRQVARTLGISPKTAGTHIERIYTKTGSSTRSTVTLFALQHGLLDSFDPVG